MRRMHRYLDFPFRMRNYLRTTCMSFYAARFIFGSNTTAQFLINTIIYNLNILLVIGTALKNEVQLSICASSQNEHVYQYYRL